jgi:hypothetical protein
MKIPIKDKFLVVITLLIIVGCKEKNISFKNDLSEMNLKGKVKSVRKMGFEVKDTILLTKGNKYKGIFEETFSFNESGNLIESNQFQTSGELYSKILYSYDSLGLKSKVEWYSEFGKETDTYYKYDSLGNIIEYNSFNLDGTLAQKYTFKFDNKGNSIEVKWFPRGENSPTIISRKTYDENGNMIIDSMFNSKEKLQDLSRYYYDDKGRTTEMKLYELNEPYHYKIFREFDDNGNMIKYERKKYSIKGEYLTTFPLQTFEYDFNNNWIKSIGYMKGKPELIEERSIEYYK